MSEPGLLGQPDFFCDYPWFLMSLLPVWPDSTLLPTPWLLCSPAAPSMSPSMYNTVGELMPWDLTLIMGNEDSKYIFIPFLPTPRTHTMASNSLSENIPWYKPIILFQGCDPLSNSPPYISSPLSHLTLLFSHSCFPETTLPWNLEAKLIREQKIMWLSHSSTLRRWWDFRNILKGGFCWTVKGGFSTFYESSISSFVSKSVLIPSCVICASTVPVLPLSLTVMRLT